MAEKEPDVTAFNPKHRIIGAIILVSLAVIFIPMILDESEPPSELKGVSEIPAKPTPGAPETRVVVAPVASLGKEKTESSGPKEEKQEKPPTPVKNDTTENKNIEVELPKAEKITDPIPAVAPADPAVEPKVELKPEKPAKTQTKPKEEKTKESVKASSKGWIVQVGVYSHPDNAERVVKKIRSHGIEASTDPVKLESGKGLRVRVGPFKEKAEADKVMAQVQKEAGLKGIVRAYP
jgi:DedD protein